MGLHVPSIISDVITFVVIDNFYRPILGQGDTKRRPNERDSVKLGKRRPKRQKKRKKP